MSRESRGFTVVELLVACGIIAACVAVVVPLTGAVRERANAAACAANLRSWGEALHLYLTANQGVLPRRGQGVQPTNQISRPSDWFNALPPLINVPTYAELSASGAIPRPGGNNSFWICPSAFDRVGTYYWSYGMNMALSVWESNQNNAQPNNYSAVGSTAAMVFLTDGPGNYAAVFPSQTRDGYNPVPRHSGSMNICFVDGHVAAVAGTYVGVGTGLIERADVRWKPPGSTWNSGR